ncbi:MAG TPA: molybdate ABC transporter substrate-binding protein [Acidobacteriota bacterium]|nr:molybdate ABC transporter substrate-binding protein [Acidobacteriota bacterium]
MRSGKIGRAAVIVMAAVFFTCGSRGDEQPLVILAAASLSAPLDSIITGFKTETGATVHVAYGGSGTLAQQIRSGVAAHLYLSADVAWIERLASAQEGFVSSWRTILSNRVVVVTAVDNDVELSRLEDLADERFRRVAIPDPELAPAGWYARAALERIGLYERLRTRLVPTDDVGAAAAAVRFGVVDVGIVYVTDAQAYADLRVLLVIPDSLHPPIRYGVATLAEAEACRWTDEFLAHLRRPATEAIFKAAGFIVAVDSAGVEIR